MKQRFSNFMAALFIERTFYTRSIPKSVNHPFLADHPFLAIRKMADSKGHSGKRSLAHVKDPVVLVKFGGLCKQQNNPACTDKRASKNN